MHTVIKMYNTSNYESWEQAKNLGGVYSATLSSVDPSLVNEVCKAIFIACWMTDSNSEINLRLEEKGDD